MSNALIMLFLISANDFTGQYIIINYFPLF